MNTEYLGYMIAHPSVFFYSYFLESIFGVAIAYVAAWMFMRPKMGLHQKIPMWWHFVGVLATDLGAALLRVLAAATFAGESAHELSDKNSFVYILLIPAIVAAIIIPWIKGKAKSK